MSPSSLPAPSQQPAILREFAGYTLDEIRQAIALMEPEQAAALIYDWKMWARPNQLAPEGDWRLLLICAGRGYGKSRTGAEFIRQEVEAGRMGRVALIGPTAADVRDVMVEGKSGLMAVCPPWNKPTYEPTKRRVTWANGAMATCYSADEPDRLRGPQHDGGWLDEVSSFRYAMAYENFLLGLRIGTHPRAILSSTPKPNALTKQIMKDPTVLIVEGSTYDNRANLPESFLLDIEQRYKGTRMEMQEVLGRLLEDIVGALWTMERIEQHRVEKEPEFSRIVVAVDPAVTARNWSDETGIIVMGLGAEDGHGYVIDDCSLRASPQTWAEVAVAAYHQYHADRIIAEVNQGGDLVETVIRTVDPNVSFKSVHASKGKYTRAEPIAALEEQGKIHHVGIFSRLEDQLINWVPGEESPDRLDSLVWAATDLLLSQKPTPSIFDHIARRLTYRRERTVSLTETTTVTVEPHELSA